MPDQMLFETDPESRLSWNQLQAGNGSELETELQTKLECRWSRVVSEWGLLQVPPVWASTALSTVILLPDIVADLNWHCQTLQQYG